MRLAQGVSSLNDRQERRQLEGEAPELYQRYLVPAMTAMWASRPCRTSGVRVGERCWTWRVAPVWWHGLRHGRVGNGGRVAGVDVNRWNAGSRAFAPRGWRRLDRLVHEGDVLALPFSDADVRCRAVPTRPAVLRGSEAPALRELRRVLVPNGRVALNVFGPIEHNPATYALAAALDRHVRPGASLAKRNEHALADIDELRALMVEAALPRRPGRHSKQERAVPLGRRLRPDPVRGYASGDAGCAVRRTGQGSTRRGRRRGRERGPGAVRRR